MLSRAVLLAALAAAACRAQTAPPIDMERLRAEGRTLDRPPTHPLVWTSTGPNRGVPFRWEGDRAEVKVQQARVLIVSMPRLVVEATGPEGGRTPFVLDTGTTWTSVSTASPFAATARVWEGSRVAAGRSTGRIAVVPWLRVGGLIGRDVEVALRQSPHDLGKPTNIMGQDVLRGLLLRHVAGRWSLIQRTEEAVAADRPSFVVPLLAPGLPMIRVRDPSGTMRFALIDTGAPLAIPTSRTPKGAWHVEGFPDAIPLDVAEGTSDASSYLRIGDWPISLLIGLASLSSADWVLDLEGGEWRFLRPANAPRRERR